MSFTKNPPGAGCTGLFKTKKYSVIIPSFNAQPYLTDCFAAFRHFDPDSVIIVVDGVSTDGTLELVRFLGVVVFSNTKAANTRALIRPINYSIIVTGQQT